MRSFEDFDSEISSYEKTSMTSTITTTSTTGSSKLNIIETYSEPKNRRSTTKNGDDDDDIFEDASSDLSILQRPIKSSSSSSGYSNAEQNPKSNLVKAEHKNLCIHNKKIREPLFLRKCQIQRAKQSALPPNICPVSEVKTLTPFRKNPSRCLLLASLDAPTYCARYLASNVKQRARTTLVYQPPICYVRFLARPAILETNQCQFDDIADTVQLLLSPEPAIIAQKMLPKWHTVTFTLAYGKHMAVKYRIIETRKQEVEIVKVKKGKAQRVSTKTLYRVEPIKRVEFWISAKPNYLKLSTVEKNDPQFVKKVLLDQANTNCIFEPMSIMSISNVDFKSFSEARNDNGLKRKKTEKDNKKGALKKK